jgi:beta-mannanase
MSWSEQGNSNGNYPGDFVAAWRHVVDVFRDQGATNATWVWCPNVAGSTTFDMGELYPGDDYVDWTCLDGYNPGGTTRDWQTFVQIFLGRDLGGFNPHNSYGEMRTLAPSKPMMIGEVASSERGGSKAAWIRDMLQTVPTTYPQIKAIVWFDWDGGDPKLTWPIASSKDSQNAFAAAISSSVYATNDFSGLATRTIQPLVGN